LPIEDICLEIVYADAVNEILFAPHEAWRWKLWQTPAYDVGSVALAGGIENFDLSFLPKKPDGRQCQSLIVSYHELAWLCVPSERAVEGQAGALSSKRISNFGNSSKKGFNDQEREEIQRRLWS